MDQRTDSGQSVGVCAVPLIDRRDAVIAMAAANEGR